MLSLKKRTPELLTNITVLRAGVAWSTSGGGRKGLLGKVKKFRGTDLDLACIALSEGRPVRMAWFDNEDPFEDGSLVTSGDNTSGKGSGDDEMVTAQLDAIPASVDALVFVVSAYKEGVSFSNVEGITLNLYDDDKKIGAYWPDIDARGNACVMARARREGSAWSIEIINGLGTARSRDQLLQLARSAV
ncbi:TerD family protein [Streptomyces sp. NPDC018019]|uniref:TerD family protein n=1 Tax=Streptomyces sp. NPDC018019 TaxID=3365030 RepID=UPI00378888E9